MKKQKAHGAFLICDEPLEVRTSTWLDFDMNSTVQVCNYRPAASAEDVPPRLSGG